MAKASLVTSSIVSVEGVISTHFQITRATVAAPHFWPDVSMRCSTKAQAIEYHSKLVYDVHQLFHLEHDNFCPCSVAISLHDEYGILLLFRVLNEG